MRKLRPRSQQSLMTSQRDCSDAPEGLQGRVGARFFVDGIKVMVDGVNGELQLRRHFFDGEASISAVQDLPLARC